MLRWTCTFFFYYFPRFTLCNPKKNPTDTTNSIFQRNMSENVKEKQWPVLCQEMNRVLKPGGYVELVEPDPCHHNQGPVLQAFESFTRQQWQELGLDYDFANAIQGHFEQAGLELVEQRPLDIPIGEWPEEPGM